jgi:hypothetical protein
MADVFGGRVRDLGRRAAVQDAALAAAVFAAGLLVDRATAGNAGWWAGGGLLAVAIALRRRWPVAMLAVATGAAAVHLEHADGWARRGGSGRPRSSWPSPSPSRRS